MAQMIPKIEDTSSIRPYSEQTVYVALRDQLPSDFVVFHSFPWLRRWRGDANKALLEGEADFVILHPTLGMLVLEVKGGEIYAEREKWMRRTERGPEEIKDPFKQASKNMHALLNIIEEWLRENRERLVLKGPSAELTYGYAVFFPDLNYMGLPPANADRAVIISHRHLSDVEGAIRDAYGAWTDKARPLDQNKFNLLFRCLTARPVFVRPIGAEIIAAQDRMLLLTETQSAAYQALLRGKSRILVQGPAGSGKTELALARAVELMREGKRVLLTCYNKELAAWLRERAAAEHLAGSGVLHIRHFHQLAAELVQRAGLAWEPGESEDFWSETVYELITTAVARLEDDGEQLRYNAILIDEAQDFYELWWWALGEDLLSSAESSLYAFMDLHQRLRADASVPAEFGLDAPIIIAENCRNTRRIATLSARTVDQPPGLFRLAPEGSEPRVLWVKHANDQRAMVEEEVRRLLELHSIQPRQIALIGISVKKGSLAGVDELAGLPLTRSAEAWRRGEGILVTTARSFKGLEADVVVLYDVSGLSSFFTAEDLYVACSRARFHLSTILHGDRELFAKLDRWRRER